MSVNLMKQKEPGSRRAVGVARSGHLRSYAGLEHTRTRKQNLFFGNVSLVPSAVRVPHHDSCRGEICKDPAKGSLSKRSRVDLYRTLYINHRQTYSSPCVSCTHPLYLEGPSSSCTRPPNIGLDCSRLHFIDSDILNICHVFVSEPILLCRWLCCSNKPGWRYPTTGSWSDPAPRKQSHRESSKYHKNEGWLTSSGRCWGRKCR